MFAVVTSTPVAHYTQFNLRTQTAEYVNDDRYSFGMLTPVLKTIVYGCAGASSYFGHRQYKTTEIPGDPCKTILGAECAANNFVVKARRIDLNTKESDVIVKLNLGFHYIADP